MKSEVESGSFRQIMGCFATGIAVVTTSDKALGEVGLTINSLTSVSLDPPLLLFCLEKTAFLHNVFKNCESFAINFLSDEQEAISRYFADRHHNAKPPNMWEKTADSVPVLRGTLGWVKCQPFKVYKGGDHSIVVGKVVALHKGTKIQEPLTYYRGRYRTLAKDTSGSRK